MQPVKILFTIPNFITAGSGQALVHVAKRLDPTRFAPSIAVLKMGGGLETEIQALGIPLLELPFAIDSRPLPTLPLRLWKAARKFRPFCFQIWHSYHYSNDYTEPLIARLAGAKAWVYTKKNMSWGGGGARAWTLRTRLAARIAAQNTAMIEQFFAQPPVRQKVTLLPRGVDTEKFRPGIAPCLNLRQQYGISPDAIVIGTVAHLVPVKGHETLIEAAARIPDIHLALAGKPVDLDYAHKLRALCERLAVQNRVHFLGGVDNVAAFHAEMDLFVLPTLGRLRMEGCPVALLEAMACGMPSIATDIPGSQDIIEHGRSGLLVPPENVEAMTAAIRELCLSPQRRSELAEAARQRILAHYTIEREVAQHETLYAEILKL